jgi:hypothetical protein
LKHLSLGGSGTIYYQWKRGIASIGADSNTYIVQTADIGSSITVTGTYSTYRWYLDGTSVGTLSSYTFNKPVGVYQLSVVVTDSNGESRSGHCWITVSDTRNITVLMQDSYGDGWNSASLRISVNGVNLSTNPTISSSQGSSNTYTFNVNTGDAIAVYWNKGSYDEECAFAIYYTDDPPSPVFNPASGATNQAALGHIPEALMGVTGQSNRNER